MTGLLDECGVLMLMGNPKIEQYTTSLLLSARSVGIYSELIMRRSNRDS